MISTFCDILCKEEKYTSQNPNSHKTQNFKEFLYKIEQDPDNFYME